MEQKKILRVMGIELLILVAAIIISISSYKSKKIDILYSQEDLVDINKPEESLFYIDKSYENYLERHIGINDLVLEKGSYQIQFNYELSGSAQACIEYEHKYGNYNIGGDIVLEVAKKTQKQQIVVERTGKQTLDIWCKMTGGGDGDYLLVRRIEIKSTFAYYRMILFWIIFIFAIFNMIYILNIKYKKNITVKESKFVFVGLFIIIFVSSIPLLIDYPTEAHDLIFHFCRIEGIKNGLLNGQFPVRIQPHWLNEHGYPVSIFYGEIFLYIPAVLRIIGFPLSTVYKWYVFLMNVLTTISSYTAFKEIGNGNKKIGILASALYTLGLYRIANIYVRGVVGEYTAMAFLPFVLYGLWFILYKEQKEVRKNSRISIILAIGYLGILNSHIISCLLVAIFTVMFCLLNIKQVFQKERFKKLLLAFVLLVAGGMGFLVPFLQYRGLNFQINQKGYNAAYAMEDRGISWAQFFQTAYDVIDFDEKATNGIVGKMPLSLGLVFLVIVLSIFVLVVVDYNAIKEKREFVTAIIIGGISMWLCTKHFPYAVIGEHVQGIGNIQFPWRFLVIVSLIAVWLVVILLTKVDWGEYVKGYHMCVCVLGLLILMESSNMMGEVLNSLTPEMALTEANITSMRVPSEYTYVDGKYEHYVSDITNVGSNIDVLSWKKEKGKINVVVSNLSNDESTIELPLILYKGHQAEDVVSGKKFHLSPGESYRIKLHIPANYSGEICVEFVSPWYWRVAEIISAMTYLYMIYVFGGKGRFKNNVVD